MNHSQMGHMRLLLGLWSEKPTPVVDLHEHLRSVVGAVVVGLRQGKDGLRAHHGAALFQ